MSKGKKQLLTVTGIILLIALTVLICYFIFTKNDNPNLLYFIMSSSLPCTACSFAYSETRLQTRSFAPSA